MNASSLRWPLLALLGLLVAAAIAFLATRTVSTDIGISSEPPNAGQALSPAAPRPRPRPPAKTTSSTVQRTTTVTVPAPGPSPAPSPAPSGGGDGESGDD